MLLQEFITQLHVVVEIPANSAGPNVALDPGTLL